MPGEPQGRQGLCRPAAPSWIADVATVRPRRPRARLGHAQPPAPVSGPSRAQVGAARVLLTRQPGPIPPTDAGFLQENRQTACGPSRVRTCGQRIKSPQLYQLSYGPGCVVELTRRPRIQDEVCRSRPMAPTQSATGWTPVNVKRSGSRVAAAAGPSGRCPPKRRAARSRFRAPPRSGSGWRWFARRACG